MAERVVLEGAAIILFIVIQNTCEIGIYFDKARHVVPISISERLFDQGPADKVVTVRHIIFECRVFLDAAFGV